MSQAVTLPSDSNIKKNEHEKLEKYQDVGIRGVSAASGERVKGTIGAANPKLGGWLQKTPGITSEISVLNVSMWD